MKQTVYVKVLLLCAAFLLFPACLWAATGLPESEKIIQKGIQQIIQTVDSASFAKKVTTDEFIMKAFQLIKNRKPDAVEFNYYQSLAADNKIKRSQLLALIMGGGQKSITWEACQTLIHGNFLTKMQSAADVRQDVESLKNTPRQELINAYRNKLTPASGQTSSVTATPLLNAAVTQSAAVTQVQAAAVPYDTYNTYFGFLHAHTSYSDGTGTPEEAYQYARNSGKLDFFAVSDHGELISSWPWDDQWSKIKAAANAANVPGSFVALWGFEWSNPIMGHINVINTNEFTNCIDNFGTEDLYNWLYARPEGFAFFNHPGDYNVLGIEFLHLALTSKIVPALVGIENWNGSNSFDKYYYKGSWDGNKNSYWDVGNQNGWNLGSLGNQDNHNRDWGTMNQFRTAVLSKSLTREGIIEAYRARRFYATEDTNLLLDFRCQGYPMGSKVTGMSRYFTVTASDKSGDTFAEIRFYRNGSLIAVQPVSGNSVSAVFTDYNTTSKAYYYVIVKENDDNNGNGRNDEAISSPIWVQ